MKIGFSFGRCIRDIVNGTVKLDDVLVIIARTWMDDMDVVADVVHQYMYQRGYLLGLDEIECQRVAAELFKSGRIHQPRALTKGAARQTIPFDQYVWMDVTPTNASDIPAVQAAWENYQMVLKLCTELPDAEDAPTN
jgi:hypothetical protein